MQILKHSHVKLKYSLKDEAGEFIDNSDNSGPLTYIHGTNTIVPGLEELLDGKSQGEKITGTIPPEKAYGMRDESMIHQLSKDMFKEIENMELGIQVHVQDETFNQVMTVTKINEDTVTVDGNHPLAGKNLHFDVEVTEIREASSEELEHGHVHGPGGHQH